MLRLLLAVGLLCFIACGAPPLERRETTARTNFEARYRLITVTHDSLRQETLLELTIWNEND